MLGNLTEQLLLWEIFGSEEKEIQVSENLDVRQFTRKSFPVEAVRVTESNFEALAKWCDGEIRIAEPDEKPFPNASDRYIKVRVQNPLTTRQTTAFVGDWVLYAGKGYKVYTDKAFRKSFDQKSEVVVVNVFNNPGQDAGPIAGNFGAVSGGGSSNPGGTHVV